jgi:hypothetical protein
MSPLRTYQAGESLEDHCRVCKTDRLHTVVAVDEARRPLRVICGYCRSEHHYRGGPRIDPSGGGRAGTDVTSGAPASARVESPRHREPAARAPWPLVSDRERITPPMSTPSDSSGDLELLLRRIIREETGLTPVAPAEKWRGGSLILRPGTPGLQEKSWPIETFFHKVVMLRNRLRALEQHLNASDLPDDVKVKLQGHISGCYGSLTSFNVLFADEADQFKGSGD